MISKGCGMTHFKEFFMFRILKIFKKIKEERFYKKHGFFPGDFRKMVELQKYLESFPRSTYSLGD